MKEDERYYVSLFGLQTAADIHSAVLAAMFPKAEKVKALADKLGGVAKEMGGLYAAGGVVSGVVDSMLRQEVDTDRTLVFDDLERYGLRLKDTLGVINTYVEHHGCRVVVIAHDKKLVKKCQLQSF